MNETSVGTKPSETSQPTLSRIPFAQIPGQSRLFLDYLADSPAIAGFYPNRAAGVSDLARSADEVLTEYSTDRNAMCEALVSINRQAGSGERSLANIERLRQPGTVAVLTGQQSGLFTGPLYTIYKAMTAIKFAEKLTELGVEAVPIFWAATEDHDLDEVSWASVVGAGDSIEKIRYNGKPKVDGSPVGDVEIDASISSAIDELFASIPNSSALRASIERIWSSGARFGAAFLRQVAEMFAPYGLVVADPMDAGLRQLSTPIIEQAINNASVINQRLRARDLELASAGYHSQVLVEPDYFPAFIINEKGQRSALKLTGAGHFISKLDGKEFTAEELVTLAIAEPERFSAGVMLRPVAQDHLFPTICYIGGAAEIAYFGQNSVVYETLGRRVTPIFHRQSFTIVESRIRRALNAYDLELTDLFAGAEEVTKSIVEKFDSPETASLLAEVEESIMAELAKLDREFGSIDVTLASGFAKRRKKIEYHLATTKRKAYAAILRNSTDANRRVNAVFTNLLPNGGLQEREINVLSYLSRYGDSFLNTIHKSTDPDERGQVVIDI